MKKYLIVLALCFTILQTGKTISYGNEFNGKIGTSYASDAEKFGLDLSFNYFFNLDPFFGLGLEADFFWLAWDRKLGEKEVGQTTADVKAETNAFIFPLYFNAQVKLPNLKEFITVEPSIIAGLGYSFMILDDSIPEYTDASAVSHSSEDKVNFYSGFTWQLLLSFSLRPSPKSNVQFTFDGGFRGVYPEKDGIEFDMSGFIGRVGVKLDL
jgi:hypothetical protein